MELEDLFDLIDELINVDYASDEEIGMRVRKWHKAYTNPNEDEFEWDDLTESEEWETWGVNDDDDE